MKHLYEIDVRGIAVAFAMTRPDDRRGTGRDLLAVMSGTPSERISAELCPRCGEPHGRVLVPTGTASVSHAGGRTAVAFAPGTVTAGAIGIDIEDILEAGEKLDGLNIVLGERFAEPLAALRRWTEVEAVLKADGRGLAVDPRAVRFEAGDAGGGAGLRAAWVADRPRDRYEVETVPLPADVTLIGSLARPVGSAQAETSGLGEGRKLGAVQPR